MHLYVCLLHVHVPGLVHRSRHVELHHARTDRRTYFIHPPPAVSVKEMHFFQFRKSKYTHIVGKY